MGEIFLNGKSRKKMDKFVIDTYKKAKKKIVDKYKIIVEMYFSFL